jgi:threonyl-tRNA synthetase
VSENNDRQTPVMIHRAILGSIERFIGILIEEFVGSFPLWLAPQQAVLLTITDAQLDYAKSVAKKFRMAGFRVDTDSRNEKIGFKIREHTMKRVPYMLVCGNKEMEEGAVAVRTRWGEDLGKMPVDDFLAQFTKEVKERKIVKPEPKEEE